MGSRFRGQTTEAAMAGVSLVLAGILGIAAEGDQEGGCSLHFPGLLSKSKSKCSPVKQLSQCKAGKNALPRLWGAVCVCRAFRGNNFLSKQSLAAYHFNGRRERHPSAKGNIYPFHSASCFAVAMVTCSYDCLLLRESLSKAFLPNASCRLSGSNMSVHLFSLSDGGIFNARGCLVSKH